MTKHLCILCAGKYWDQGDKEQNKDGIVLNQEQQILIKTRQYKNYTREIKDEVILKMRRKKVMSSVLITIFIFL